MKKQKILIYDIETFPNLAYVWGKYEQNVLSYVKEWDLASFAYKWLGEKKVHVISRKRGSSDLSLTKKLWKILDEADIVIAHNGDAFDNKKAHAKFVEHGLMPPTPYHSIDTRKVAKRYFNFNSNSLQDLGILLNIGQKTPHTGFKLWLDCMKGNRKAWDLMEKYNKQDVKLLEGVYLKLRPWIDNHPAVLRDLIYPICPKCGSKKLNSHGWVYNKTTSYRRLRCRDCQGLCRERLVDKKVDKPGIVGI